MAKINNLIVVELQDWDHDALICCLTKYFCMIRLTIPDDTAALLALAKAALDFSPDELEELKASLADHFKCYCC